MVTPWKQAILLSEANLHEHKVLSEEPDYHQLRQVHLVLNAEVCLLQPMAEQPLAGSKEFKALSTAAQMEQFKTRSKKSEVNLTCKKMRSTTLRLDSSKFKFGTRLCAKNTRTLCNANQKPFRTT